jgi:hypothetical protein
MKCRATASPIDQVEADCAVVPYYEDERPLKDSAGLADWRLCGVLSRYILDENIDGHFGETLMFPVRHKKLKIDRVVMIGLGPKPQFQFESFSVCIRKILDTLYKLQITNFTMELPGLFGTDIDIGQAAKRFCEALAIRYREDHSLYATLDVMILARSDQLKKINPIFSSFEKKTREELGQG